MRAPLDSAPWVLRAAPRVRRLFWVRRFLLALAPAVVGTAFFSVPGLAGDHWERWLSKCTRCEDRSLAGRHARAGCPRAILPWAGPTYERFDCGYYVGGGSPFYGPAGWFHGERRCPDEGVWGVDYAPWTSRVRLQWFHGRRAQGFGGQYEPNAHNNPLVDLVEP